MGNSLSSNKKNQSYYLTSRARGSNSRERSNRKVSYVQQLFEKRKRYRKNLLVGEAGSALKDGPPVALNGNCGDSRTSYVSRLQEARGEVSPYRFVGVNTGQHEEMAPTQKSAAQMSCAAGRKSCASAPQQRQSTPARRRSGKPPSTKFHHTHLKQRPPTPVKVPPTPQGSNAKAPRWEAPLHINLLAGSTHSISAPTKRRPDHKTRRVVNIQKRKQMEEIMRLPSTSEDCREEAMRNDNQDIISTQLIGSEDLSQSQSDCLENQISEKSPKLPELDLDNTVILQERNGDSLCSIDDITITNLYTNNNQDDTTIYQSCDDVLKYDQDNELDVKESQSASDENRTPTLEEPPPLPPISELLETIKEASEMSSSSNLICDFKEYCQIAKKYEENSRKKVPEKDKESFRSNSSLKYERRLKGAEKEGQNTSKLTETPQSDDEEGSIFHDSLAGEWDTNSVTGYNTPLSSESSKSLLTFDEAKQRIMEGKKKPVKKNLEYYKQLEELGLGYIKDGVWMPSDVVASLIWKNAEKQVNACEAKWVGKVGKNGQKIYEWK